MSWKKYGGLKNLQDFNNISVNNITTDTFTVRSSFLNVATIQGDLDVFGKITVGKNVIVTDTVETAKLKVDTLATIEKADILNDLNVSNDLHVNGIIYLNTVNSDPKYKNFLTTYDERLGINTDYYPEATLDINSIRQESLHVYTNTDINKNILARNVNNSGIVFLTDPDGSYIEFYGGGTDETNETNETNETKIPYTDDDISKGDNNYIADASINYHNGGILELNAKTDVKITSGTIFNKKNTSGHLLNEPVIIYDIPIGTFFYNTYDSPLIKTGNALTLISNDTSSNTFLNIVNPNKQGLRIGGGAYPVDLSRNMAIFGVLDICQNLTPTQMIVSGNNSVKCKSTTGFNTFAPITEKYTVDINGPVIITNTEISTIVEPNIQINNTGTSKNPAFYNTLVVGVGISRVTSIEGTPDDEKTYETIIWTSNNGGQNWKSLRRIFGDNNRQNIIFNGVSVYNNKCVLISGNQGLIFLSIDGGITWIKIKDYLFQGVGNTNTNLNSITVIDKNDGSGYQRVFVSYFNKNATFFYFDLPITIISNTPDYPILPVFVTTKTTGTNTDVFCDASSNLFCITSNDTIFSYQVSALPNPFGSNSINGNINTDVSLNIQSPYPYTYSNTNKKYKNISVYDSNFAIAVGENIISHTTNGGQSWRDIPVVGTFNSVRIIDSINAIAIGDTGKILYTNNGCQTWNPLSYDLLNSSGMADRILDKNNNLLSISIANKSTFILSSVPKNYIPNVSIGTTKIFYIYIPGLFDMPNNNILDICGNMTLLGSLNMYGFIHQF